MKESALQLSSVLIGLAVMAALFTLYAFPFHVGYASEELTAGDGDISINIADYKIVDGRIAVNYELRELKGQEREVDVYGEIYDGSGKIYGNGRQKIFLGKGQKGEFLLLIPSKERYSSASLLLEASSGESKSSAIKSLTLGGSLLTGRTVEEQTGKTGGYFILFLVVLGLLFIVARKIHIQKVKRQIVKHEDRLIPLDVR